jgi:hypothetical protein
VSEQGPEGRKDEQGAATMKSSLYPPKGIDADEPQLIIMTTTLFNLVMMFTVHRVHI